MNKPIKKLIACALIILSSVICRGGEPNDSNTPIVGRDDPFGGLPGEGVPETSFDIPIVMEAVDSKPPLFARTVTLKFLKASNLRTAMDKMSSEHGSISYDDNTNSLIICDTKENLERIVTEIKKADQTPKQIIIEVVIIDVQLKDDTEIGVDWDLLTTAYKDFAYRQSLIYPNRLSIIASSAATIDDTTAFRPVGLGSEVVTVNDDIRNVVNLLQEKRNVDILASPRVMVVSGQKAEIKTVEEIPYQEITSTSEGGQLTSTQFKEIGVTMQVKATVAEDGKILLEIKPSQSVSTGTSIGGVPVVDKREASTTLLMDDGQVVVMGGLRRQQSQKIKYQVPLLGDLPLIGFIFSDYRTIVENSELLVLLSPHIYKGEAVPAEAMARYNQIKDKSLIEPPAQSESQPSKQNKKK
jgi:type II secretory pathway component GspD/PulD (secretin)